MHFVHAKGALLQRPGTRISSPIGFLLTAVPKCFTGESFQAFRLSRAEQERRMLEESDRQRAEVRAWQEAQQAILDDPATSEADRSLVRSLLNLEADGA